MVVVFVAGNQSTSRNCDLAPIHNFLFFECNYFLTFLRVNDARIIYNFFSSVYVMFHVLPLRKPLMISLTRSPPTCVSRHSQAQSMIKQELVIKSAPVWFNLQLEC